MCTSEMAEKKELMRDVSTAASGFAVAPAKEGLQHQNGAMTPQTESGGVTEKHSEASYSYFGRYGYRDISQKKR